MSFSKKLYLKFVILLSWFYPQAGASLAQKIFLTPTRVPRPDSEADFFETAKKYKLLNRISAFEWGTEGNPVVLLVHGWSGRGTQMGAFVKPLVESGFRVVAIDGPAHGTSEGDTTNVGDFANTMVEVQKALGPLQAVIAHSFGAGCSIIALQRGLRSKKVVLVAGPARYERVLKNFFQILKISPKAQNIFIANLQRKVGIAVADLNVGDIGKKLNIEAMIVHDTEDKEVKFQSAIEIKDVWPQVQLFKTQGLGHRRILRDPQVLHAVTEFVKS